MAPRRARGRPQTKAGGALSRRDLVPPAAFESYISSDCYLFRPRPWPSLFCAPSRPRAIPSRRRSRRRRSRYLLAGRDLLGHRPDRHRQDRGLRAADPAASRRRPRRAPAQRDARPDPDADARARDSDRRNLPRLWPPLHLRSTVIFGGVGQKPQIDALARGVDVLVATPGRLLDLMEQGHVRLDSVAVLVLDEADRMLDLGFIRADPADRRARCRRSARRCCSRRPCRARSNSSPRDMLHDPVRVEVTPPATTVERIDQRVIFVASRRQARAACRSAQGPGDQPRAWSSPAPSTAPTASRSI